MLLTVEAKLYPTAAQAETLESWLRSCCWCFNRALEQRIKAYKRRGESPTFSSQCALLTGWRDRMPRLESVPVVFQRDALRRVDRGMRGRRVRSGGVRWIRIG